ncbi:MAG: VWA domain-containing protein [Anaerolineae bacterium]|nr:VWA domain-containing protein [Anaerolineae bacterium]
MDHSQNYYAILGVSPDATAADIRTAYRQAARRFHPDANKNEGAMLQFQEIALAHELLADEAKRRQYDAMRARLVADPPYFQVNLSTSKRILPQLGEPQVLYMLVEITPFMELAQGAVLAPLNVALVLDRSTSMKGPRLDRVKAAAHQIIDQLGPVDFLSLVEFSDRAEVLIPATSVTNPLELKARVNMMTPGGGTEIFQGLQNGFQQVLRNQKSTHVNHVILITDGQTFDAEHLSLDLADEAVKRGVGISAMGIGDDWNDAFLDEIASRTGGSSAYINSPNAVVRFLNERIRSLGSAFAERLRLSVAPDPDVHLESAFKLIPNPQPISVERQPLQLGALESKRPTKVLLQLQMPTDMQLGFRALVRVDVMGDILAKQRIDYKVINDFSVEVAANPAMEDPPRAILEALGKLTLYRMQQKAEAAIQAGRIDEATRRLENLSTRLLAAGHTELAKTAMMEARRVRTTHVLSEEGRKTMKFGTRMLLSAGDDNE